MKRSSLLVMLTSFASSDGFTIGRNIRTRSSPVGKPTTSSVAVQGRFSPLTMYHGCEPSSLMIASPILSAAISASSIPSMDPFVEAEIFNDAAHIALDMSSMLKSTTLAIRIAAFVGRIFVIAGDYAPDHAMLPEEVVFQTVMLCAASAALVQSISPFFKSTLGQRNITMRDRKCYASLFRPSGVEWMQFNLLASVAMEWMNVAPGTVITTDEVEGVEKDSHVYWLYSGEVVIENKGAVIETIQPKMAHLIGDITFVYSSKKTPLQLPRTTATAGPMGATLLRMDTVKLKKLMKSDENIDKALRNIIFEGMQERIASLLSVHAHG